MSKEADVQQMCERLVGNLEPNINGRTFKVWTFPLDNIAVMWVDGNDYSPGESWAIMTNPGEKEGKLCRDGGMR